MSIILTAYPNSLEVTQGEHIVEGGIYVNDVEFRFPNDAWEGMALVAVFESALGSRGQVLGVERTCKIPWEVIDWGSAGSYLKIGLYGAKEEDLTIIVRPTVWTAMPFRILPGVDATPTQEPTPTQYQQMLAQTGKVLTTGEAVLQSEQKVQALTSQADEHARQAGIYANQAKESANVAKSVEQTVGANIDTAKDAANTAVRAKEDAETALSQIGTSVEDAEQAATRAEQAAVRQPVVQDGTWWVWDVNAGQYLNTGVNAQGTGIEEVSSTQVTLNGVDYTRLGILLSDRNVSIVDVPNGTTPHIGDNGNWWVGETDTGVAAQGPAGDGAEISEDLDERLTDLETQMAELLYEAIAISSFSHNAGTKEMGSTLTAVTLSWKTNKTPTALTLDGETIDPALTSQALSGLSITANKTWTLKATDERGAEASKTTTVSFLNGVYYGAAAEPSAVDSAFILGLTKTLTGSRGRTVTVDVADGQYAWYCLPVRLGACTFTVGGFEGGFDLVATMDFTNASGYTESYYVYRSSNPSLGSTKVVVT